MSDETRDLEDCTKDAKETLVENLDGGANYLRRHGADEIVSDLIHECADGAVPIYTGEMLDVFGSDMALWYIEPDNGFEGCEGITEAISRVIYDAINQALYEYASELEGDDLVCEATDCGDEDDHDESADDDVACKQHCGGPDECTTCEEESELHAEASDADYSASLAETEKGATDE